MENELNCTPLWVILGACVATVACVVFMFTFAIPFMGLAVNDVDIHGATINTDERNEI